MPDWSYQTLFRPLLFQLPARTARDCTLHAMGILSRLPGGSFVIKTLGHMESSPMLQTTLAGIAVKYPVGLSGGLDPRGTAHKALAQFGIGFIEIGPVSLQETVTELPIRRDLQREAIVYPTAGVSEGLDKTIRTLRKRQGHSLPLMLRIRSAAGVQKDEAAAEQRLMMEKLSTYAAAFYIELPDGSLSVEEAATYMQAVRQAASSLPEEKPMLLYIPLDDLSPG
jgi:dihydroorotate dehydrogenase